LTKDNNNNSMTIEEDEIMIISKDKNNNALTLEQ